MNTVRHMEGITKTSSFYTFYRSLKTGKRFDSTREGGWLHLQKG